MSLKKKKKIAVLCNIKHPKQVRLLRLGQESP